MLLALWFGPCMMGCKVCKTAVLLGKGEYNRPDGQLLIVWKP